MSAGDPPPSRFQLLRAHPIFPVLVFVALSLIIRDNYPFTHYSMYSNPTPRPLSYCFIADGAEDPLPLLYHTGISPSKLTKRFNKEKGRYEDEGFTEAEIREKAAADVIRYLRQLNSKRKKRLLPEDFQLVRMQISIDGEGFKETPTYFSATTVAR